MSKGSKVSLFTLINEFNQVDERSKFNSAA